MVLSQEGTWLRTDEPTDVVASTRHTLRLLAFVKSDPAVWKWIILSAHSALQGAMVCHLSGSAQLGCLSSKSAADWLEWHERDRRGQVKWIELGNDELGLPSRQPASKADQPPRQYMAKPEDLFVRLHKPAKRIEGGCGSVVLLSDSQKRSFGKLNALRNQFTHFAPTGWSIELSGISQLVIDIFDIIKAIANDYYPFRHLKADERTELKILIDRVTNGLSSLRI